jgi:hypothetical protein
MRPYLPYRPYRPYLAGAVAGAAVPIWTRDLTTLEVGVDATFSRASTAYHQQPNGTLVAVASGEARFSGALRVSEGVYSGEALPGPFGLLMEPAATNLVTSSEEFNGVGAGVSLTSNTHNSIHGGLTADTITVIGAGYKFLRNNSPVNIATGVNNYTTSIWVKKGNWRYITCRAMSVEPCPVRYDFDTNTITLNPTQTETVVSATATVLGSGFVRIDVTMTLNSALGAVGTQRYHDVCINDGVSWLETSTVANGSTLIVGPMQVTLGSTPSSYIPTTTVAVTRAVDALSYTGVPADNETRTLLDNTTNDDENDWNGTVRVPTVPKVVNSITVYAPGERPV